MKRQDGFTLVEMMTAVLIIGIVINVWLPNHLAIKAKAQAARIIGDLLVIRDAATMYYSDTGHWPTSTEWGRAPDGLDRYLPGDFSWDLRPEVDARYSCENLGTSASLRSHRHGFAGVSVFSADNALLKAILGIYGGRMVPAKGFGRTRRVIFIIQSAGTESALQEFEHRHGDD